MTIYLQSPVVYLMKYQAEHTAFVSHTVLLRFGLLLEETGEQGSSVSIATDYGLDGPGIVSRGGEIFCACPDRPWGPPSRPYNGYRVFPGDKVWPGSAADHSPPSSAEVMED
jgi:hypothetical protein